MKRIFGIIVLACLTLAARAQVASDSLKVTAVDSTVVNYVQEETSVADKDAKKDIMVTVPLTDYERVIQRMDWGRQEFILGSSFMAVGIGCAVTPLILSKVNGTQEGTMLDVGMYATGAAFAVAGIIYLSTGLTKWCQGTAQFKGLYFRFCPYGLEVSF